MTKVEFFHKSVAHNSNNEGVQRKVIANLKLFYLFYYLWIKDSFPAPFSPKITTKIMKDMKENLKKVNIEV